MARGEVITGLRHKGKGEPPERVVVPFEGEGDLRSLLDDREDSEGGNAAASTSKPDP